MAANPRASGQASPERSTESQTFRSVAAVIAWWVWVLFALGNLIDLAVQGRDHLALVAAAILLMVTGVAYVTALRPRVIASEEGIAVVNPLRDHRVPWALVEQVDLASLLRVRCRRPDADASGGYKVISAWAVPYSRRRQMTTELRARRRLGRAARDVGNRPFGVPDPIYRARPGAAADTSPESDAIRIARLLNDRAVGIGSATAPAEASQTAGARAVSTWSWPAIAALAVPALILLIVVLV
ncbi:MAG TPA: PH domain-containing protein [Streptosporangiaceae bacterium]